MRCVVVTGLLAAIGGCGDNGDACGHVETIDIYSNIWSPHLAVDATHVYYTDYNIDGFGTNLVLRRPVGGGDPLEAMGQRGLGATFGRGMVLDERFLYWAAQSEPTGNALYQSPLDGGRVDQVFVLNECEAAGIAVSATHIYAGNRGCGSMRSRVRALERETGMLVDAWIAGENDGDVRVLATGGDTLFVATTAGVFAVRPAGIEVLAGGNAYHVSVVGDTLYYSIDDGIFATPVAGGPKQRIYFYEPGLEGVGAFAIDGDDLYISEPPRLLHMSLATEQVTQVVADHGTGLGSLVARDGYAYWAVLALPDAPLVLNNFGGAVLRVSRPCD